MFKTIKAKLQERNLRKEKDYLEHKRTELLEYETLLEDLTKNYEPLRTKCTDLILDKGLNYNPLKDILEVEALDNNKFKFKIYGVKGDCWDGRQYTIRGDLIFEETIQLNSLEDNDFEFARKYVNFIMPKLDHLGLLTDRVAEYRKELEELENKIKDLEKQI